MMKTVINGIELEAFGGYLLSYEVGPTAYENNYVKPPARLVPVKLQTRVGLRSIRLKIDFEGESMREITLAISRVTAILRQETSLMLPDGFHYWCEYVSASEPQEMAPWILQVEFELIGFRHEPMETKVFTASGSYVTVEGNCTTPAVVKITPSASTVVFGGITFTDVTEGEIVIDGVFTTVTDEDGENIFAKCDMTAWPDLEPGLNEITFSGASRVEVSYYPIWQ